MPLIETTGRQSSSVTRESEGNDILLRGLRDGTLVMADFVGAMALEGRVFGVNAGTITGPINMGTQATGIDSTEPDLMVTVPADITIILLDVIIQMEAYGATGIFEAMVAIGSGGVLGSDSDLTPANLNTGSNRKSSCSAGAASSNDATYMTSNVTEIIRWGAAKAVTVGTADDTSKLPPANYEWQAKQAGYWPILKGAAGFAVYAPAATATGFIMARWLEVPSVWFN
ncbi:hypothetical protein LCGC14_1507680 [marine sediment metagenome]|uniref:Uncharacterized protein n=1 Tax=marine sediment metagenome TaxID=412755 RepID=A0A0F9JN22_9ZZZZ